MYMSWGLRNFLIELFSSKDVLGSTHTLGYVTLGLGFGTWQVGSTPEHIFWDRGQFRLKERKLSRS